MKKNKTNSFTLFGLLKVYLYLLYPFILYYIFITNNYIYKISHNYNGYISITSITIFTIILLFLKEYINTIIKKRDFLNIEKDIFKLIKSFQVYIILFIYLFLLAFSLQSFFLSQPIYYEIKNNKICYQLKLQKKENSNLNSLNKFEKLLDMDFNIKKEDNNNLYDFFDINYCINKKDFNKESILKIKHLIFKKMKEISNEV